MNPHVNKRSHALPPVGAPHDHLLYHLCIKQMMFTHGAARFILRTLFDIYRGLLVILSDLVRYIRQNLYLWITCG